MLDGRFGYGDTSRPDELHNIVSTQFFEQRLSFVGVPRFLDAGICAVHFQNAGIVIANLIFDAPVVQ